MPGKHFLQLPGPSNVPDRILRAMDYPTIDHRGPEFSILANDCLEGIKTIFKTKSNVIIYPASGTGAWEAALVNTLNENDLVLMVETGHFASLWNKMAQKLGIKTEFLKTDWQRGAIPEKIYERLKKDPEKWREWYEGIRHIVTYNYNTYVNNLRKLAEINSLETKVARIGGLQKAHDEMSNR